MNRKIESLFNEQITLEFSSSMDYLSMATWSDVNYYPGASKFLYRQSNEEKEHMMKFVHYLTDLGKQPVIPGSREHTPEYRSLQAIFEKVLQNEERVTKSIHHLVDVCLQEKEYASFNFLQWFLEEQREEESTARKANDLFKLIGQDMGISLYTIDQELMRLSSKVAKNE